MSRRVEAMAPWLRRSIYAITAALWLTGCLWLLLHFFFQRETEFGSQQHPLQPTLLVVHGSLALVAVFLFGWISASHVGNSWGRRFNRTTGILLIVSMSVLTLTGFAGYYLV